jgi:hypothetical protein
MPSKPDKTAVILSFLIAMLASIASAGGLLFGGIYRDNAFVRTTWLGNDAVTLFLAVPILVAGLVFSRGGFLRAQLVWLGALDYMLYNYAFYLFGAAFNAFFLIYAAILGLSIFALIFGLANLDPGRVREQFRESMPVRWIGAFFLFVAAGLSVVYLAQSIGFILNGQVPDIVLRSEHPTSVVFALDFTLLIPWNVIGALWLMRGKPWGYVIAGILSVKGPLYTLILSVNSILVMQAGLSTTFELPLWGTLTALGLLTSALLYGNMKTAVQLRS